MASKTPPPPVIATVDESVGGAPPAPPPPIATVEDALGTGTPAEYVSEEGRGVAFKHPNGQLLYAKTDEDRQRMLRAGLRPETMDEARGRLLQEQLDAPLRAYALSALQSGSAGMVNYVLTAQERELAKQIAENNPVADFLGSATTTTAAALIPGGLAAKAAGNLTSRAGLQFLARTLAEGAVVGGMEGGRSAGEEGASPEDYALSVLTGAAVGAVSNAALGQVGLGIGSVAKYTSKKVSGSLKQIADKVKQGGAAKVKLTRELEAAEKIKQSADEVFSGVVVPDAPAATAAEKQAYIASERAKKVAKAAEMEADLAPHKAKYEAATKSLNDLDEKVAIAREQNKQFHTDILPLKKKIESIKKNLAEPDLDDATRQSLQAELDATNATLQEIEHAQRSNLGGMSNKEVIGLNTSGKKEHRSLKEAYDRRNAPLQELKRSIREDDYLLSNYEKKLGIYEDKVASAQRRFEEAAGQGGILSTVLSFAGGAMGGKLGGVVGGGIGFSLGQQLGSKIASAAIPGLSTVSPALQSAAAAAGRGVIATGGVTARIGGIQSVKALARAATERLTLDEYRQLQSEVHGSHVDEALKEFAMMGPVDPSSSSAAQQLVAQANYLRKTVPQPNPLEPNSTVSAKQLKEASQALAALTRPEAALARYITGDANKQDQEVLEMFHRDALDAIRHDVMTYIERKQLDGKPLTKDEAKYASNLFSRKLGLSNQTRIRVVQAVLAKGGATRLDAPPMPTTPGHGRNLQAPSATPELQEY